MGIINSIFFEHNSNFWLSVELRFRLLNLLGYFKKITHELITNWAQGISSDLHYLTPSNYRVGQGLERHLIQPPVQMQDSSQRDTFFIIHIAMAIVVPFEDRCPIVLGAAVFHSKVDCNLVSLVVCSIRHLLSPFGCNPSYLRCFCYTLPYDIITPNLPPLYPCKV